MKNYFENCESLPIFRFLYIYNGGQNLKANNNNNNKVK